MGRNVRERRQDVRRKVRLPVVVELDAEQRPVECETLDLSLGGARVRASDRLPEGPVVLVLTAQEDDALLVAFGDVVEEIAATDGGIEARLRFHAMRPGAQSRLARLLAGFDQSAG